MAFWSWSRTASSNGSSDSTINFLEGQAPGSLNDSCRAVMARTAEFRDDIAGAIVTGGTSTAYTVGSYQVFDNLAHLNGQIIAFSPHTTNAATVTLNVDSTGAKPLRSAPSTELLAGTIIQGTPYLAIYNNSDGAFYLQGFYGNPYNVPLGSSLEFWGGTAPNSSFVFPFGQAISRTTYSALFSLFSTTYGSGDGSTTFNIPDVRGRITAGKDDMGGSAASRLTSSYFGGTATNLGAVGGGESETLTLAQLPTGITAANASQSITVNGPGSGVVYQGNAIFNAALNVAAGSTGSYVAATNSGGWGQAATISGTNNIGVTSNNTSGNPHNIVQPTIVCNRILRVA